MRAFCEQQGVAHTSFYDWKRELRSQDAAGASAAAGPRAEPNTRPKPPLFVPLTVLPDVGPTIGAAIIAVRCPSGHVVLLPAGDLAARGPLFAALTPPAPETRSC